MAILDDARKALRMSNTALDSEITDLISGARKDLILSGIITTKANDDTDPLIKRTLLFTLRLILDLITQMQKGFKNLMIRLK